MSSGERSERLLINREFRTCLPKRRSSGSTCAAPRLIEGGNLLMMPGREAAAAGVRSEAPGVELEPAEITALIKKKRKSFDAFARALQAIGSQALRAIEAKDTDALIEVGGRMEEVCESCHKTFWYPQKQAASRN